MNPSWGKVKITPVQDDEGTSPSVGMLSTWYRSGQFSESLFSVLVDGLVYLMIKKDRLITVLG